MGKLTNADGTISYEGKWYRDKPQIEGTMQYPEVFNMYEQVYEQKLGERKQEYSDGNQLALKQIISAM